MDFKTEAHEQAYGKVDKFLGQIFGEMVKKPSDRPVFLLQRGTALTHIIVAPWSDDDAVIVARSYVNYGADLAPDLLKFLLNENADMRFGAFGVDDDGDIFFEHTIVGSTCDKEEIKASVLAVSSTADRYDEPIRERWGGMREIDRIKQMI
jgi:hypothetical protein